MHPLIEYQIPVKGLKSGSHSFVFQVGKAFFEHFQNSIVEDGAFEVRLELDKRPEMMLLHFDMEGHMNTDCDRCLAPIRLPIHNYHEIIVKFDRDDELGDDIDVIFMPSDTTSFDISTLVYELLVLSVPMIKTYDCQAESPRPCNESMLQHLSGEKSGDDSDQDSNPTWDILKDIN